VASRSARNNPKRFLRTADVESFKKETARDCGNLACGEKNIAWRWKQSDCNCCSQTLNPSIGIHAGRILKGENSAEVPVQQVVKNQTGHPNDNGAELNTE
jgi:hypothetical protein